MLGLLFCNISERQIAYQVEKVIYLQKNQYL